VNTETAGNAMTSLLGEVTGAAASHSMSKGVPGAESYSGQELSKDSIAVVSGLVEAFMHKMSLLPGEKRCLERNMENLVGDVMGTVGDIVTTVKALIEGHGAVSQNSTGSMLSAGIDSAMKITSLVGLSEQLVKNCVHGDALAMLENTAHHLVNGTYLQHRFIVNGVDIAHSLSDSIISYEKEDFHQFGTDIGTALRKMLLSTATNGTRLPEGIPDEVIIQQCTDGLMRGFFVQQSAMEITDTAHPDIDVHVNLHQCIAGNSAFFKELWLAAWDLIAQLSLNAEQHGFAGVVDTFQQQQQQQTPGQPNWTGELMIAMMQFPMALSRCNVSAEQQTMFTEAIQSLGDLKLHFTFPNDHIQATKGTEEMAAAVEAWTKFNFEDFGFELGKLFREMVMLGFPQKYSVDSSGRLLLNSQIQKLRSAKSDLLPASTMIIGGGVATLFVAFAVVRTRRSSPELLRDPIPMTDIEDGESYDGTSVE
jgi:hypothetical protein